MQGQLLGGRYQVLHVLGAGNFGQTYLAEDIHRPENTKCVVKHLKPASSNPDFLPTARNLFRREAETLEKLGNHNQIPRLLAYFEEKQEFYLVQEFIDGQLLRVELTAGHRWPEERVILMLQEVLDILEFVHSYGVIHRDIKPDNLIRRQVDGKPVLIDFGAVKQVRIAPERNTPSGNLIGSTIAIGTPGYMPPEQAQGRPRPSSDIYALGMIGIEALTGQSPMQFQQDAKGEFNWQAQAQVSQNLAVILSRMVRYHFQERYQSAAEVSQALQQLTKSPQFFDRVGRFLRNPMSDLRPKRLPAEKAAPPPAPFAKKSGSPATELTSPRQSSGSPVVVASPRDGENGRVEAFSTPRSAKVFISYRSQDHELKLAQQFYDALKAAGHEPFMAGESIQLGEGWAQRIDEALKRCDYFLLLLSPQSASSEMVLEEVRTVKQLHDARPDHKPVILPVRVDFPMSLPLNYELRGYLHRIQQRFWRSPSDTPSLVQEVLGLLARGSRAAVESNLPATPTSGSFPTVPPPQVRLEDAPPLPVAEPELPEGQVDLASTFYIERSPIESRCYETIVKPGALIRIKAPRQMGKTSLMARILHQASQQGYRTVPLSLQLADGKVFADLDQFLRWLCASIGRRLRLPNKLNDYWDDIFGSKYNCTAYFEEYLLAEIDSPLALGLDEVDRVFEYPEIASDFFGLLRAWHEEAKNRELWKKLRLVVVHATEVYIPLNTNQSPFNVGLPIELPEFSLQQVAQLARLHQLNWQAASIEQLMAMLGGHPYLVRLALYHIARQDIALEQLLREAPTETGLFRDHLRGHWWNLQQHPELAAAIKTLITARGPVRLEATALFKLHSLGLVRLEGNEAQLRCELYRHYFCDRLQG
jgi:serine/threonine-protein kinase